LLQLNLFGSDFLTYFTTIFQPLLQIHWGIQGNPFTLPNRFVSFNLFPILIQFFLFPFLDTSHVLRFLNIAGDICCREFLRSFTRLHSLFVCFLWFCSPARAMASCGSAAQRGLWPTVALQPSAGYGLLWLCSPERAMASCGSAAQSGLWPPVALQPRAGCGLLWLCSPERAMASCGSAAQSGLWPPRSRGFVITHNDAPESVGLLWTNDQLVAETST
jgi:hypothetical protein